LDLREQLHGERKARKKEKWKGMEKNGRKGMEEHLRNKFLATAALQCRCTSQTKTEVMHYEKR